MKRAADPIRFLTIDPRTGGTYQETPAKRRPSIADMERAKKEADDAVSTLTHAIPKLTARERSKIFGELARLCLDERDETDRELLGLLDCYVDD